MSISDQLKAAIHASGISQSELGRRANVSQENISLFLAGKRGFSLVTVDKLCKALQLVLVHEDAVKPDAKVKPKKGK